MTTMRMRTVVMTMALLTAWSLALRGEASTEDGTPANAGSRTPPRAAGEASAVGAPGADGPATSPAKTTAASQEKATAGSAVKAATAGTPAVHVSVEPPNARIGDTIRLTAAIDAPEPWMAEAPEALKPGEKLGPFHVVDLDVTRAGTIVVGLTADEAGSLEIPGFDAVFRLSGKDDLYVSTPTARVVVASLLGEGDATLSDIKPPADLPVPWPWREIGLGALGAAVLVAIGIAVRRWMKKPVRPAVRPEEELPPGVTADAWARAALEALLGKALRESGRHREFHIELADLARRYLELRFRIPALERTTEEVGAEMMRALLPAEATSLTSKLLARCDRVKFAKHVPERSESDETVAQVRELIERTAPVPAPPTAPAAVEVRPEVEGTAA